MFINKEVWNIFLQSNWVQLKVIINTNFSVTSYAVNYDI